MSDLTSLYRPFKLFAFQWIVFGLA